MIERRLAWDDFSLDAFKQSWVHISMSNRIMLPIVSDQFYLAVIRLNNK